MIGWDPPDHATSRPPLRPSPPPVTPPQRSSCPPVTTDYRPHYQPYRPAAPHHTDAGHSHGPARMGLRIEGEESATRPSASDDSEKTKMLRGQAFKRKLVKSISLLSPYRRKKRKSARSHLCKLFITLFTLSQRVRVRLQCRSRCSTALSWSLFRPTPQQILLVNQPTC
jgi:hypothetical protein